MISFKYVKKTCIVTGAAGGLGQAIAKAFLTSGANVVVTDIVQSRLDECQASIPKDQAERFVAMKADVTSTSNMEGVFASTVKKFGRLDVLVNNAGVGDLFAPVGELEEGDLRKRIEVNTIAPTLLTGMAVRQMLKQDPAGGVILNVGSTSSLHGFRGGAAYTISKHGLIGLTKSTAAFYGKKGVRSVCIMPGFMITNIGGPNVMTTAHQEGLKMAFSTMAMEPDQCSLEEVANVALSLCSDGMGVVNGACVAADHGWTAF